MINIFNLFLFLSALWAILAFTSNGFSISFIIFGFIVSLFISVISWKFKIINKDFNFLFLNLGFYQHFLTIFFTSLFHCILFLVKITFTKGRGSGYLFQITPKKILGKAELILFVATISFIPGISYVGSKKDTITIYTLSKDIYKRIDLSKFYHNVHEINDDSLI